MKEYYTYKEVEEIVIDFLRKRRNLKEFAQKHGFGYSNILKVKGRKQKAEFQYLVRILKALKVDAEICVRIEAKKETFSKIFRKEEISSS